MREAELIVEPNGEVRFVYDDELAEIVRQVGPLEVRRASHVEPVGDGWSADLSPVGGPTIEPPFGSRAAALAYEVEWLRENGTPFPGEPT